MSARADVSFGELVRVFGRIGLVSFGGPAGQIALMHRELVEERSWLSEARFLRALNFCMLLPGPEAMQLATYAGWTLHGVRGGLASGLLFVIPGAVTVMLLAILYMAFGNLPAVEAAFFGVKAAVLAIVLEALLRVSRRALSGWRDVALAVAAFLALFAFALPFPLVIAAAGLVGAVSATPRPPLPEDMATAPVEAARTFRTVLVWLAVWIVPLALVAVAFGADHVFTTVAWFFSKLAMVTFGGAYAVLAYMAQQAVERYDWLSTGEMLDALGLAETTPGPLILVTQFVAYIAGYREAGGVPGGIAAAFIALWATFAPCFLWIFAAAPYVDRLAGMPRLSAALAGVTAAVVGVIANLSLWFGLHVLFARLEPLQWGPVRIEWPIWASLDAGSAVLFAFACLLLFRLKAGLVPTLAACGALGLLWRLVLLPLYSAASA